MLNKGIKLFQKLHIASLCENFRKQGKIRFFGLSFHDELDAARKED